MAQSTFSLSWEAHRTNICNGLSALQQNQEFVDMTLAADGHFVKVHQMVMALASPYFKDLISSAGGRHPVIFLNKISYSTLGAILEYIYTGEVQITIEKLSELIQTAKDLHIRGLEDMKMQNSISAAISLTQSRTEHMVDLEKNRQDSQTENKDGSEMDDEICYFEITDHDDTQSQKSYSKMIEERLEDSKSVVSINVSEVDESYEEISLDEESETPSSRALPVDSCVGQYPSTVQFTVSNQGSLQMILNRYMYYLKHSNRNNSRQWRCVDYLNKCKCPAIVTTRDDMVLQRLAAHTHPHHDKRILKKVRAGAIYAAIKEAEQEGLTLKTKVIQERMERDPTRHIDTINTTTQGVPIVLPVNMDM